ncbi:MAG: amidohydrolase family protein [Planctomycetes bacterium]|nr:amidohydrolase family protein [Planctomycetota bacterium]
MTNIPAQPGPAPAPPVELFEGLAVIDAAGTQHRPGALLVERGRGMPRLLAVGTPAEVASHPAANAARLVQRPDSVLIPGLVNAHTHLDLTHVGPLAHDPDDGFMPWIERVRDAREAEVESIARSVGEGVELSLAGGTVAVGDIAGSVGASLNTTPFHVLAASPLLGISYLEFFGIGRGEPAAMERLHALEAGLAERVLSGVRLGLQPHAPYSVGPAVFRDAVRLATGLDLPVATHLAETPEEIAFVAAARGPQRAFLERLGIWDDSILGWAGRGDTPVGLLAPVLGQAPMLAAHVNAADDADLQILAKTGTRVAYCPRASAYFAAQASFGPHRYREMLDAGIVVALGTDSIVVLPPDADGAVSRISVLDEMRLLHRRDGTDPTLLLEMGTRNGAIALGLDPAWFTFGAERSIAGVVAVKIDPASTDDPLATVLRTDGRPELLLAAASF